MTWLHAFYVSLRILDSTMTFSCAVCTAVCARTHTASVSACNWLTGLWCLTQVNTHTHKLYCWQMCPNFIIKHTNNNFYAKLPTGQSIFEQHNFSTLFNEPIVDTDNITRLLLCWHWLRGGEKTLTQYSPDYNIPSYYIVKIDFQSLAAGEASKTALS